MTLFGMGPTKATLKENGTCSISTYFQKTGITTDDVTLRICILSFLHLIITLITLDYQEAIVAETTMLANETGMFNLPNSFIAAENGTVSVNITTDSPIDVTKIQVLASPLVICIYLSNFLLLFHYLTIARGSFRKIERKRHVIVRSQIELIIFC